MALLSLDDPVFVIDLSAETMAACGRALDNEDAKPAAGPPTPPTEPLRALAIVLDRSDDPVLLAIEPTRDVVMLDQLARLLRIALLTGVSVAELATRHGDEDLRQRYRARGFPSFVYEGFDPALPMLRRLPDMLWRAVGR